MTVDAGMERLGFMAPGYWPAGQRICQRDQARQARPAATYGAGQRDTPATSKTHLVRSCESPQLHQAPAETRWGHRWIFELSPDGPDATIVTEIHNCSRAPEDERLEMDNGNIWIESMTKTLERLGALCTRQLSPADGAP